MALSDSNSEVGNFRDVQNNAYLFTCFMFKSVILSNLVAKKKLLREKLVLVIKNDKCTVSNSITNTILKLV